MLSELTRTILSGAIPLGIVALCLVALHRRYPAAVRAWALALLTGVFAAGVAAANAFEIGDPLRGPVILRSVLWFLATVLVLRLLTYYAFTVVVEGQYGTRVPPLLSRVTRGVLYVIAAFVVLTTVFPESRVGPLLATSAVTSLVLGLALQPILTNFFAGIVIVVERPFRINDWIQIGDHEGRVTRITWRTTAILTRQNDTVIFPNANIAQETIQNFLYPHPLHMARIHVGVQYRTPPHRVRAAMIAAAGRVRGVLEHPSVEVYVSGFDDSAVTYELRAWIDSMAALRRVESDVRQEIWEEFHRQGIVIPFPIRTLEISRPEPRHATESSVPSARLFVSEGPDVGVSVEVGSEVLVGRAAECGLRLHEPSSSANHLRIAWQDGAFVLTDLGSTHGTRVNGRDSEQQPVGDLDRIQIGATTIILEVDHGQG